MKKTGQKQRQVWIGDIILGYNKIPEVISEPNLIDFLKQDYRLAFTILSQSLVDKTEVTSEQYYKISGGFCTNIQVPENLQMSPEQKLAGRKIALIYLISNTLKICDAPPVTHLMMTKTQQLMSGTADRQFLSFISSRNMGSLWFLRTAYGNYQENSSTERIIQKDGKKEEVPKKRFRKKECNFCYKGITL